MSSNSPGATVLKSPASTWKPSLVAGDAPEQRAQLEHPAPLGPGRVHRAEMHAEQPQSFARRHDLDERMPREPGSRPLGERHRLAAEEAERLLRERSPFRHAGGRGDSLEFAGSVASCSSTRSGAQALITVAIAWVAAAPAVLDVVGQEAEHHGSSGAAQRQALGFRRTA